MKTLESFFKRAVLYVENGNLIPFMIAVSVFHYIGALAGRDPLPIAIAIGIAVDIGQYRIVKAALKYDERRWWFAALAVTAMSFGYHVEYYGGLSWSAVLFALPLPLMIVLLAALSVKERWSAKLGTNDSAGRHADVPRDTPTASNDTPTADPAPRGTYEQFKLAQLARNGAGPVSADDVVAQFGVPKRTAYRWLARYRDEVGSTELVAN